MRITKCIILEPLGLSETTVLRQKHVDKIITSRMACLFMISAWHVSGVLPPLHETVRQKHRLLYSLDCIQPP